MSQHILIVGQGLAGSLTAYLLMEKGYQITLADNNHASSSTKVSGGIINPITGKRFVLTDNFETYYTFAKALYADLEQKFSTTFLFEKPMVRILTSNEEKENWRKSQSYTKHQAFWSENKNIHNFSEFFDASLPFFIINKSAYCHTGKLIDHFYSYFSEKKCIISSHLNYDDLTPSKTSIRWKKRKFDKIIFAEGYKASLNPFFGWIPFVHAKGEILSLRITGLSAPDYIYNYGKWLLPLGHDEYKTGATYCWDKLDEEPTQEGKEDILTALKPLLKKPFEITDHTAGVRPVCKDQNPVIGQHPQHDNMYILNGLGSKGALLGPYCAHQLTDLINNGKAVDKTFNISRFKKYFN